MKQGIWLSYDLGVKGDYESLYKWLDHRNALECGDSLAYVNCEYTDDVFADVRTSLFNNVKMTDASRFYMVAKDKDNNFKGKFIVGARKAPPWTGYDPQKQMSPPDEA
jgi:hypothetical protein